MMRFSAWMASISICVFLWHECAENPALFCYRIGMSAFACFRSRPQILAPVTNSAARNNSRCLNPSAIYSTRSTMLKD
jgi:hypothetical protein